MANQKDPAIHQAIKDYFTESKQLGKSDAAAFKIAKACVEDEFQTTLTPPTVRRYAREVNETDLLELDAPLKDEDLNLLSKPLEFTEIGQFSKKVEDVPKRIPKLTKSRVELFITDVHLPFNCKTSYELTMQVARAINPDILYLNGDFLDAYAVSQWQKDPAVANANDIQSEFDTAHEKLLELKAICPDADFYYKDGNHEDRFNRFLFKNAPELRCLRSLSVKSQLKLDELEIHHVPQNDKKRIGNLFHLHGHELKFGGQNPTASALKKMFTSVIFGHVHKIQSTIFRKYDDDPIGAWSIGCLAEYEQDYVHHAETWGQGFAVVEYLPSGIFHVDSIAIIKEGNHKMCKVKGQWFEQEII